jgi:hypothetical protein
MSNYCISLTISLLVFAVPAHAAKWVPVGPNDSGDIRFVETLSIQREGNFVTFWTRTNYVTRNKLGAMSDKGQQTLDCRRRLWTLRYVMFFSDSYNRGRLIVETGFEDDWTPVSPDTLDWETMRFVCEK